MSHTEISGAAAEPLAEEPIVEQAEAGVSPQRETSEILAQVEAMRKLGENAPEWAHLMCNVLKLPLSMLPAVRAVLKSRTWTQANDPLDALRRQAVNRQRRIDQNDPHSNK